MSDAEWVIPALAAVGLPVLIKWLTTKVEAGDKAQQAIIERMEKRIGELEDTCKVKADVSEVRHDFERGSEKFDTILNEIRSLGDKIGAFETKFLVELERRPTRDEVFTLLQNSKHGGNG